MASRTVDASDDHIDNTIETTLDEVRDVLSRPRLQRLSPQSAKDIGIYVDLLAAVAENSRTHHA